MRWYEIVLLFLIVPIGAYIREQTYRSTRGNTTIGRDIERLLQNIQRWRRDRRERKELRSKYKYLNNKRR